MNKNNKIAIGIILVSLAALSVLSLLGSNGRKQPIEPNDSLSVNSSDNSNPSEEQIVNKTPKQGRFSLILLYHFYNELYIFRLTSLLRKLISG